MFKDINEIAPDPIFFLDGEFKKDKRDDKINLVIGAFQNEKGQVSILNAVKKAEQQLYHEEQSKSYTPMSGFSEFNTHIEALLFGNTHSALTNHLIYTNQTIGGTGGLSLSGQFLKAINSPIKRIHISNPSWVNHKAIYTHLGFDVVNYTYYNKENNTLNFEQLLDDLYALSTEDAVILHSCCHNPTGIDLNHEQWQKVLHCAKQKGWLPIFDTAYLGFDKSIEQDAFAIRLFTEQLEQVFVINSLSKNFGLYSERVGSLSIKYGNIKEKNAIKSQLDFLVRKNYSNPPSHGAKIAYYILHNNELKTQWLEELKQMRLQIRNIRELIHQEFKRLKPELNLDFIINQTGMFSYTGLSEEQVNTLKNNYGIYMTKTGRINVAGLNHHNYQYFAQHFCSVLSMTSS